MSQAPLVATLVRKWAREQPQAVAVAADEQTVSYGRLWSDALAWAEALAPHVARRRGGQRVIGVLLPRGSELPAVCLGAWLSGAAYLPLDPCAPAPRIRSLVQRAGCAAVVADAATTSKLDRTPPIVDAPVHRRSGASLPGAVGSDVAYIIYTSGSSGEPKGVQIGHDNLADLVAWYCSFFELGPGVRTATLANVAFDGLILDIWGTLAAGASLHVPPQPALADLTGVVAFLDRAAVEHCYVPTPRAELLFAAGEQPARVRSIATGGDRLRVWPRRDLPFAVHNLYGPTETTVAVTATGDLRFHPDQSSRLPPIGRPRPGTRLGLADGGGEIAWSARDRGQGELVVGGLSVGRGYLGETVGESGSFGEDARGARIYRTGDICRWHGHELDFVERRDAQVKVQGYRLELSEVEANLLSAPQVSEAAALLVEVDGRGILTAWFAGDAPEAELRAFLTDRVPAYMVPDRLIRLPTLPTTPNGKIDRRALGSQGSRPRA
jgi:amino acid adenylation domain-containing protein